MGEVPHHYLSQILLNLEICDLELGHFIEFVPGNSDNDYLINIVEVKRDREWFARELPKMKAFWDSVVENREKGIEHNEKYIKQQQRSQKRKKTETVEQPPKINRCFFIETNEPVTKVEKVTKVINNPLFIEEN